MLLFRFCVGEIVAIEKLILLLNCFRTSSGLFIIVILKCLCNATFSFVLRFIICNVSKFFIVLIFVAVAIEV
jgi:hypothetical protein